MLARFSGLGQESTGWDYTAPFETPMTVAVGPESVPEGDFSSDFVTMLPQAISAITQWDLQRKAYELNLERVQQGLPPIDTSQLAPGVNVGLTPQAQQLTTFALIGLGALGLFYILSR